MKYLAATIVALFCMSAAQAAMVTTVIDGCAYVGEDSDGDGKANFYWRADTSCGVEAQSAGDRDLPPADK